MDIIKTDVAIIGAGGGGLRAAIAIAEAHPELEIALISKVYPMRSHTVAAEGGAAGVVRDDDSLENHFNDTVSGGDWLCEQDVVEYFVNNATNEMIQLEHWGCPWSRKPDGKANVRRFGGMKIPRTWFAADKSGFHILHTLFQTSIKYPTIKRYDEHFCLDLIVEDGRVQGVLTFDIQNGITRFIQAKSVVLATGGAGRVYRYNTNGGIVTGDGRRISLCDEGNPGMASGGMGDLLSGIIAALLAQGWSAGMATRLGAVIHAEAADLAAAEGERGMLASDLLPWIRRLVNPTQ